MDWTSLIVLGGTLGGTALLVYVSYRFGKTSVLKEQAVKNAEIKDKQMDAAVNRVDAIERLRFRNF